MHCCRWASVRYHRRVWVLTAPPRQTLKAVRKGPAPGFPGSIGLDFKIDACKPFSVKPRRLDRRQGLYASGDAKRVAIIGSRIKPLLEG